jgi:hypothetical protein
MKTKEVSHYLYQSNFSVLLISFLRKTTLHLLLTFNFLPKRQTSSSSSSSYCSWLPPWGGRKILGFHNSKFFRVGVVSSTANSPQLYFVWPLPYDLSGMHDPTRSLHSLQYCSPKHWGARGSPRGKSRHTLICWAI